MLIAERTLSLRTKHGLAKIPVCLFAPENKPDGSWACRYAIDWPEGRWVMEAGGVDAVQAIMIALQMIGSELYTSGYHKAGQLFFESPGKGYGFPVPAPLRPLLEGDDKRLL